MRLIHKQRPFQDGHGSDTVDIYMNGDMYTFYPSIIGFVRHKHVGDGITGINGHCRHSD